MYFSEDIYEIAKAHREAKRGKPQTKGFRHVSEIKYDDLTFRAKQHLEASGFGKIFSDEIDVLGENILQSPLERATICFLRTENYFDQVDINNISIVLPDEAPEIKPTEEPYISIHPQAQLGPFFLDFGLVVNCANKQYFFDIECDGKDFHSGSAEILEYDRMRDSYVKGRNYYVWRVSGSEINAHPLLAIQNITEKIGQLIEHSLATKAA